mmetsp:Transcript_75758/g.67942  ORF Transcript_75758/g.67942 Transcript_75758/m.67942 type:complete len:149 (-) Transcript_75758:49-495(-)
MADQTFNFNASIADDSKCSTNSPSIHSFALDDDAYNPNELAMKQWKANHSLMLYHKHQYKKNRDNLKFQERRYKIFSNEFAGILTKFEIQHKWHEYQSLAELQIEIEREIEECKENMKSAKFDYKKYGQNAEELKYELVMRGINSMSL